MDSRELAELQRLMKKASEAGLMDGGAKMQSTVTQGGGKAQSNSSPAAVTGAMTDACKRRKNEPEELSSDSEWDATVGRSSDSPAIDNQARYVTEGDTVVAKPMKKGDVSGAVKTPDTSHVRHVDKSIAVPPGVADFKEWSQTVIVMDKYADMNWSFSELIAASDGDAKITRYITWIVGTYAAPAVKDPQNQAEDFGMYARACGGKPKPKGYQRKTK